MRAYFSVFRMRLRMELQYRGAMIGGIACQMFFGIVLVALYRALYASKQQALPIESVTTYVWFQQSCFRMLISTDPDLMDKIRSGNISYDMCRPVNMYWFYGVSSAQGLGSAIPRFPSGTDPGPCRADDGTSVHVRDRKHYDGIYNENSGPERDAGSFEPAYDNLFG